MKNTLSNFTILLFMCLFFTNGLTFGKSYKHTRKGKPIEAFYLLDLVDDYYFFNYEFPDCISKLIVFTEYCLDFYPDFYPEADKNIILSKTMPLLKRESSKIKIENKDNYLMILGSDTLVYYSRALSPCDISLFVNENPHEYATFCEKYLNARFFDSNNKAIFLIEDTISSFKLSILNLQKEYLTPHKYHTYSYEGDTVPINVFLEYKIDNCLEHFCDNRKVPHILYYEKLQLYLKGFCKRNSLTRIVFLTPDYF